MSTILVYDDAVGVPSDIASLTGIERFGLLLYKRQRLWEHVSAAVRAADFTQRVHLVEHADRLTLADEIVNGPPNQRYVYLTSDVVSSDPELLSRFLAKLAWSDTDVVARPAGGRPGSVIASLGAGPMRQLLSVSRTDNTREAWWTDRRDHIDTIPSASAFLCLCDADLFVRYLSGSFYTRAFNAIEQSGRTIVKRSKDRGKMKREHDYWYYLPAELRRFVVQPYAFTEDPTSAAYRMERLNIPDMAVLWIHGPDAISTRDLSALLDTIFDWFDARPVRTDAQTARTAAHALYVDKFDQRMRRLLSLDEGQRLDRLLREGTTSGGLEALAARYHRLLTAEWERAGPGTTTAVMHGDLCFSNILFDKRSRLVRFIDPRGATSEDALYGDPYYDIAKLSHSVMGGYDFVNNGLFDVVVGAGLQFELRVPGGRADTRQAMFLQRVRDAGFDPVRMRLYEASLFLSMLPLHAEDPRKLLGFVLTAIGILDEVEATRAATPTLLQRGARMSNPFGLPDDHVFVQAFKFLGVGIIAAASHYGIYVGLVAVSLLDPFGATLAGWVVSTAISYVLNAKFTFQAELGGWTAVKFWTVTIGGGGVNATIVYFGEQVMHYAIAGVVAIVFGASFNFTGHKLWTFPSGEPKNAPLASD